MIDIASQFLGKGVRLICANAPGGQLPLETIRASLEPLTALENEVEHLKAILAARDADHAKEFEEYQASLEAQMLDHLATRGITLGALLRPNTKPGDNDAVKRPIRVAKSV